MADPLNITVSVVGIAVPALHALRLLSDDLQQLRDAPTTVQQLRDDLSTVDMAINSIQSVKDRDWEALGDKVVENTKTTISICQKSCDPFRSDVQRWTRHSNKGQLNWQDRATVGFFKEDQIQKMSGQLQNCKTSINSTVGIAVL